MSESEQHVKIVVNGETKQAESSLGKVQSSLLSIRSAAIKAMHALGVFGLAWNGIQTLVGWFTKLREKLDEIQTRAARLRFAAEMSAAADATGRLVSAHETLSRLMKRETDELSKQRQLRDAAQAADDDREDGDRAADRARQLYFAESPEEEQRLRDQFAEEDERIAARRKDRDRRTKIRDLENEESVYSSKAKGLRENNAGIDAQLEEERFNLRRTSGDNKDAVNKRIEALEARKKANEREAEEYEREAKFRRDQIAQLEAGKATGQGPSAGYWNREKAAKDREDEAARKWKDETEAKAYEEWQNANEFVAAHEAEKAQREADAHDFANRTAAAGEVSQNRLTALGLGSGVTGGSSVPGDVQKLVRLMEKEVEATKANKPKDSSATEAVYS